MKLPFGLASFLGEPEVPCVNMVPEPNPAEESGVYLRSRMGLSDRGETLPSGVDALFQRDGVLFGARFAIAGGVLYEGTGEVDSLGGNLTPSMAGNETGLFATAGQSLFFYDGATVSTVAFPDSADVTHVFGGASRIFAIRADTGKVYWTDALADDIDALDFATAESAPDTLLQGLWLDDKAILFGTETIEVWASTTDDALPIQPIESLLFEKGLRATGLACVYDYGFAFVGNDNVVYLGTANRPQPISEPWLSRKIAASVECRLFAFLLPDGREALCLRLDGEAHVFVSGGWCEFQSYGEDNWLPQCWAKGVFGCSDGRTAQWGTDYLDFGGELERRWRGGLPINAGGQAIDDIVLRCKTGQTPYLSGDHTEPVVEMRLSRNLGKTWGNWRAKSLGQQGQYGKRVQWRGLGMASAPGLLAELRVTAPVDCDVRDLRVNEGFGGRAA